MDVDIIIIHINPEIINAAIDTYDKLMMSHSYRKRLFYAKI